MPKRKYAAHNIKEKLDLIQRVRNGESRAKICRENGIPESTLRGWLKDEDKLRGFVRDLDDDAGLKRKRARTAADPGVDKATFQWFAQKSVNTPISGVLLQAQAVKFHEQMRPDGPEFVASNGWLHRFKNRHGIGCVGINGEIKSADTGAAEEFIPELEKYIMENGYTDMQIYNADETTLYYRILPSRTLALKRNKASAQQGLKVIKDRVTLLFCCNRAGTHKVQPLMIGKFNAPTCFHHINRSTLPLQYTHSKKAWMTSSLFNEFSQDFCACCQEGESPKPYHDLGPSANN